jgi:TRAP-type uncharacterized transport system fused permease subunit
LASYVAAGIAQADINKVGWTAFTYGITCYILPFMFVFGPGLMLSGSFFEIALAIVSASIGVVAIAAAVIGYARAPLPPLMRIVAAAAGLSLLHQSWMTDLAGLTLAALVLASERTILQKT